MAGVSITTVSRVVNSTAPVAGTTVERVRQAIESLHYTPSAAARSLAGHKTNTIGLYLPQISGPFFATFLKGVEAGAREAGCDLLVHAHPRTQAEDGNGFSPLGHHNADGLIVFVDALPESEIVRLHSHGLPLVLLFQSAPEGVEIPSVTVENRGSAARLVTHLIEAHGRRRIAYLRGPQGNRDSAEREHGYRDALESHGIPFKPSLVGPGNFRSDEAEATVRAWLKGGLVFDAIFGADDEAASGAILAVREAGLRVPEDVAIVGFDDVFYARVVMPPLTTVRSPIEAAGFAAARQLVSIIRGGKTQLRQQLRTEVIIRQSCGCP